MVQKSRKNQADMLTGYLETNNPDKKFLMLKCVTKKYQLTDFLIRGPTFQTWTNNNINLCKIKIFKLFENRHSKIFEHFKFHSIIFNRIKNSKFIAAYLSHYSTAYSSVAIQKPQVGKNALSKNIIHSRYNENIFSKVFFAYICTFILYQFVGA